MKSCPRYLFSLYVLVHRICFNKLNDGMNNEHPFLKIVIVTYVKLVGFGRACAPVRCAHPSFWAHCHTQRGAARPFLHRSFAAPPKIKKLFPKTNCLPSGPNSGRQGHIFFHWAKLHPTELRGTIILASLHPKSSIADPDDKIMVPKYTTASIVQ